jgi:mercuric reductase
MNMIKLKITGMTCGHCAKTVKIALESVEGVERADVHFPQGYAEVYGKAEVKKLIVAVNKAGYGAEELQEGPEVFIPKEEMYDLFVLGGGSAGFAAAIRAHEIGAKVLIAERGIIGGTCLNRGCIPSKYLIEIANTFFHVRNNPFINTEKLNVDMKKIADFKQKLVERLRKEKYWDVLEAYPKIDYLSGEAKILTSNKALVNGKEITFGKSVIAVGSKPIVPSIKGINQVRFYTSDTIFDIDYLPKRLLVIGGGPIGLEIGQAFLRLGSEVILVERFDEILPSEERELSSMLRNILQREGMEIITGAKVIGVRQEGNSILLEIEHQGEKDTLVGSDILLAVGRSPNTHNIGLESVGIKMKEGGFIETDEFMQTSNPNFYAAGDCVGKLPLVTVAAMEGGVAAENALLSNKKTVDYATVPRAVFTDPELASVGLKEEEAKNLGFEVDVRVLDFSKVPRAVIGFREEGLAKMVLDVKTKKILGVHVLSSHGAEVIHKAVLIVKYGLTVDDVIGTTDVYPTLSESIKLVAQSFVKDVSKLSCCVS